MLIFLKFLLNSVDILYMIYNFIKDFGLPKYDFLDLLLGKTNDRLQIRSYPKSLVIDNFKNLINYNYNIITLDRKYPYKFKYIIDSISSISLIYDNKFYEYSNLKIIDDLMLSSGILKLLVIPYKETNKRLKLLDESTTIEFNSLDLKLSEYYNINIDKTTYNPWCAVDKTVFTYLISDFKYNINLY